MGRVGNIISKIKYIKTEDLIGGGVFLVFYPLSLVYRIVLRIKGKKIWLISENATCMTASDNAFSFYQYLIDNNKKEDAFFVINKKSPHIDKFRKKDGRVIIRGSFKHWMYYLCADKLISTHSLSAPSTGIFYLLQKLGVAKRNLVFLQHGITQNDLVPLYYENCNIRLFICGAKKEFDYINKSFHYPNGYVEYTGFARFDRLHKDVNKKQQILIIPTWRRWIAMDMSTDEDFQKTEFYCEYQGLLNNRKLIDFLEENGLNAVFYVHQLMDKYLRFFSTSSSNIIIASYKDYDIQELISASKAMVTDYSSVFFDFSYMKKPIIYFQFDKEKFRELHYKEGYFDYKKDGFGPVCDKCDDVIDEIIEAYRDKFEVKDFYLKRINEFFAINDSNNCKRIYEAIKKL